MLSFKKFAWVLAFLLGSLSFAAVSAQTAPTGQLINLNGTVYLVGSSGLYGFPSLAVFNSWGFNLNQITTATSAESAMSMVGLVPTMQAGCDSPIDQINGNCSGIAGSVRVGQLININGTVYYVTTNGLYGFPNAATFYSWNYTFSQIVPANSAEAALPVLGLVPIMQPGCGVPADQINSACVGASTGISAGTLINKQGTVYLVGTTGLYGFPNAAIFYSWGFNFSQIVPANGAEGALPVLGLVPTKNPNCGTPLNQIAGSCTSPTPTPTPTVTSGAATLKLATNPTLGQYLTASNGMTLYYSAADNPNTSNCSGSCAAAWPPYTVAPGSQLSAASGIGGAIGAITRADGTTQVTYNTTPLYFWKNDVNPGDTTGQAVGGFVVASINNCPGNQYFCARPVFSSPSIQYLSPSSGAVGSTVTIIGSGFTSTNNTITFGIGSFTGYSSNGTSLTFTVPASLSPTCAAGTACPQYVLAVTANNYNITVSNANGASGTATFTVTSPTFTGNNCQGLTNSGGQCLATPVISNISPTFGATSTTLTITGSGFTATNNTFTLISTQQTLTVPDLASNNGSSITVIIPDQGGFSPLLAGSYRASISNGNGASNILPFAITGG